MKSCIGFKKFFYAYRTMSEFTFSGTLSAGREDTSFERTVEAGSEKHAREKLYAELGSEHGVPRSRIAIEEVES